MEEKKNKKKLDYDDTNLEQWQREFLEKARKNKNKSEGTEIPKFLEDYRKKHSTRK